MPANWMDMDKLNQATLDQIKGSLTKQINTSAGLTGYDLTAPAYEIYPIVTPIRNAMPRTTASAGSTASNWKQITAISATTKPTVGEGLRNGEISYTASARSAAYKTYGRDDSVTKEAESQGRGFEDLRALSTASLLRRVMVDEEDLLIGGNTSLALGATPTPTVAAAGSGATLGAATYSVICVALTYFGYQYRTASAIPTFAGANAQKSAAASQAVTLGQTLSASVAPVTGAVAYAWYVGTSGSEKLEKVTTINSVTFSAPLAGTGQAASVASLGSDNSTDANDFDGILSQLWTPANGALVTTLATGTAGTGTKLTSDNAGGVPEIDTILQALWDGSRVGPDVIYCNSQQIKDIATRVMSNAGGAGAFRLTLESDANSQQAIVGGVAVMAYVNKFTQNVVKLQVHPTLPAGTMVFQTNQLPDWYPGVRPAGAWDLHLLDEYYEIAYGQQARKWEHGVYARGVLRGFLPTAQAILTNIAPG